MQVRAKKWLCRGLAPLLAILFLLGSPPQAALAQDAPDFSQQELDQMLAPIALYPDALLSQILMASTYPREVVEAERWSLANPGLRGWQAAQAVQGNNWDPSVMSLVAFPQILRMMSNRLSWTERLGDAFLAQEDQLMDTVQNLRHRAEMAGNLRSNDLMRVDSQGEYISIYQADPLIAYEPYYNASEVYGSWWWPQSPPVYWAPWAGYSVRPGFGSGFLWGAGITLSTQYFFGNFDWRQRHVNVANVQNSYIVRDTRYAPLAPRNWQHAPEHRRGEPYRPAIRARFAGPANTAAQRNDFRGHLPPRPGALPPRSAPPATPRPAEVRPDRTRPATAVPGAHPALPVPARADVRDHKRPATAPSRPDHTGRGRAVSETAPKPAARPHALENIGQTEAARQASERGRNSRQNAAPATQVQRPAPAARQPAPARAAPSQRPPEAARSAPAAKPSGGQRERKGRDEK
jgi:hypothetical protein